MIPGILKTDTTFHIFGYSIYSVLLSVGMIVEIEVIILHFLMLLHQMDNKIILQNLVMPFYLLH